MIDKNIEEIRLLTIKSRKILEEIGRNNLEKEKQKDAQDQYMIESQIKLLKKNLLNSISESKKKIQELSFSKTVELKKEKKKDEEENQIHKIYSMGGNKYSLKEISPIGLEKETINRIRKKKEEKSKKKEKKESSFYSKISSQVFSKFSKKILGGQTFQKMEDSLKKANLNYTPNGYSSIIFMTTFLATIVGGFLFLFFLFFNFGATLPIITRATEPINVRFLKVFWILILAPIGTFLMMYIYPSLEKKSSEESIDTELPFATIHMAAISGSMINPIKIFEIISSTKEYPAIEKEFTKMINEINLYGYDLVSALKNTAKNSPSKKLAELLNGLATTITSGGDLPKFFDKRAETLLFNYKIEQQKSAKAAETFMDIYISLVIAAPMILMLLMMIMKISGLGIGMSISMIALLIILGVTVINIFFLAFLHLKKQK